MGPRGWKTIFSDGDGQCRGFTLIELSIVLVIIGLMVGGVVGGRALMEASRMQAVIREINGFKTAVNAFQSQYQFLPGDFPEAYLYWGTAVGCANGWVVSDENNCNGNGDGFVGGTGVWSWESRLAEGVRAWQHLALAEILPGTYSGKRSATNPRVIPGTTVPQSKWGDRAAYMFEGGDAPYGDRRHYIQIGVEYDDYGGTVDVGIFTGAQALKFEKKIDDGLANKGYVYGFQDEGGGPTDCTDAPWNSTNAAVRYVPSAAGTCFLHFYY